MTHPFHRSFVVRWGDVDANGHLRNTAFSEYASDTRIGLFASWGWSWARFREARLGPVLFREELVYRREAAMGDEVLVDARAAGLSPDAFRWSIRQRLWKRDGTELATVTTWGSFFDVDTRKLTAPPRDLADALRAMPRGEPWEDLAPVRKR
jgi:acyl-CoA thioester hydrolase